MKTTLVVLIICLSYDLTHADCLKYENTVNYLDPLPPYSSDFSGNLDNEVFKQLFGNLYMELWMIVKPSSNPEYSVGITRKLVDGQDFDLAEYSVIAIKMDRSVSKSFSYKPLRDSSKDVRREFSPAVNYTDISEIDAELFIVTWHKALRNVRYRGYPYGADEKISALHDGSISDFYSNRRAGRSFDYLSGMPYLMKKSGECLFSFATATKSEQYNIFEKCRKINKDIADLIQ